MSALSPRESTVLELVRHAAATGACCPTNVELAHAFGQKHDASGSRVINALKRKGLLAIRVEGKWRVAEVDGRSTAVRPDHWADGRVAPKLAEKPKPVVIVKAEAPVRLARDPCFRCGVRGDLGCSHRRIA